MSRFKKRMVLASAFLLMILVAAIAFFYRPTRLALERAEAFQFRRMIVSRHSEDEVYRFFFVTNRDLQSTDIPLEERFDNQRRDSLTFGFFDTKIEPTLGIGMIINPTDWFQNEEIKVRQVQEIDQKNFVEQLRKQVQASPYRSVLININGFRERFPSALRKTAFLSHVMDIDTPVLVFDWPGDQGSTLRGYRRAQRVAGESGNELARAIQLIIKEVQPERIWLVANSMGAQVVVYAFSELSNEVDLEAIKTEVDEVILTAPDVDRDLFDDQFKKGSRCFVKKSHRLCLLK